MSTAYLIATFSKPAPDGTVRVLGVKTSPASAQCMTAEHDESRFCADLCFAESGTYDQACEEVISTCRSWSPLAWVSKYFEEEGAVIMNKPASQEVASETKPTAMRTLWLSAHLKPNDVEAVAGRLRQAMPCYCYSTEAEAHKEKERGCPMCSEPSSVYKLVLTVMKVEPPSAPLAEPVFEHEWVTTTAPEGGFNGHYCKKCRESRPYPETRDFSGKCPGRRKSLEARMIRER